MTPSAEAKPAAVTGRSKQAGEVRARWPWTEPTVWTERMLTALEDGVKGGRWYSLMDKVSAPRVLRAAYERVRRNGGAAGVDHVTVERFGADLETNLEKLSQQLRSGSYRPQGIRRQWIPKPGSREKRGLGIPTVRDRVVQTAVRWVLEPIFERHFAEHSYGFRPGRGCHDALRRVDGLLEQGFVWVVDADLRRFFDTIPHAELLARVRREVSDGKVLALLEAFLRQPVMDGIAEWSPEEGTPQGAVISPLLSNIYLDALDHRMADDGFSMVRYADDFVVLCRSREEAEEALSAIEDWVSRAGLALHPEKTRIVDASQPGGFDFLGYHFERGYSWPSPKSLKKLKARVREQTKRTNGHSLETILRRLNRTLQGWMAYFGYSHGTTYARLDKWIRMRLRSILRKRQGRRGRGRGQDHQRWPNAYFAERGLFSLKAAYVEAGQPSWR